MEINSIKSILSNFRDKDRKKVIKLLKKTIKDIKKDIKKR